MTGQDAIKPKRPLKNDLYSLAAILSVPLALALVFPYSAIGFSAVERSHAAASCSFVALDAEAEATAIESARSAWKGVSRETDGFSDLGLLMPSLPESDSAPLSRIEDFSPPSPEVPVVLGASLLPPSLAAGDPFRIAPDASQEDASLAFPKSELLKIDLK